MCRHIHENVFASDKKLSSIAESAGENKRRCPQHHTFARMYIPAPDSRYPTLNSARLAVSVLALAHSTNMCKHNAFYSIHVFRLSLFSAIIYLTAIRSHVWVRYAFAHVLHFCHFFFVCAPALFRYAGAWNIFCAENNVKIRTDYM